MAKGKLERNCPYCGVVLKYNTVSLFNRAERIGRGCRPCGQSKVKVQNGYKTSWNAGLTKEDPRVAYNCRHAFGKDGNIAIKNKGKTLEEIYGVDRAKEIRLKKAESYKSTGFVAYNPKSIPIIEKFGEEHGYNFQHAENGGEVAFLVKDGSIYYVDGYDKENNVIVEYYERFHYTTQKQIDYDLKRQTDLIELLGCEFVIIRENKYDNEIRYKSSITK